MVALDVVMRPFFWMWKVRLPFLVFPVLLGLRRYSESAIGTLGSTHGDVLGLSAPHWMCEALLLPVFALVTGFLKVHFSAMWWLLLISASVFELQFTLSVSTVLALSLLLGWYGCLVAHPHAIEALWGGSLGLLRDAKGVDLAQSVPVNVWRAWDLLVHAFPAVALLCWYGYSVGPASVLVALPMNIMWLAGVGLRLARPLSVTLADSNAVYGVDVPKPAWRWIFGCHWNACALWCTMLVLPAGWTRVALVATLLYVMWHLFMRSCLRDDLLTSRATFFLVAHVLAAIGAYWSIVHEQRVRLFVEFILMWQIGGYGITCGAHRLWAHRSYDAKFPFRLILMLLNSFANQGTIYHWARDHRNHHKYTDTTADPHDASRGFFFAHIGWLLVPKHPDVRTKGESIPCADLLADPLVAFQKWGEETFMFNEWVSFGLPALYGHVVYGDALMGFLAHGFFRWILCLHATWCVNSVAHFFGDRPYNPNASPRESFLTAILADGEGWHSYHHTYPWDYATSEYGAARQWNPSKIVIDLAALMGQVTRRKRADSFVRKARQASAS